MQTLLPHFRLKGHPEQAVSTPELRVQLEAIANLKDLDPVIITEDSLFLGLYHHNGSCSSDSSGQGGTLRSFGAFINMEAGLHRFDPRQLQEFTSYLACEYSSM